MYAASRPRPALSRVTVAHGVVALTALAAALRFSTLGVQSYWIDEGVTAYLVHLPFGDMLDQIPRSESTPPLYYVLAWLWSQPFGVAEVGLRSLSALLGTLTVPVAYAAVAQLATRRAGVIAAALAAVNPLLVWYSQEARAYALLVLLAGLSLWFFARRSLAGWALASAAALATHYFALFVVVPEAVWLLAQRRRRGDVAAVGFVAVAGAALLPLAIDQANNRSADYIRHISLAKRIAQVPKQFLVGFDAPLETLATVVALVLAVAGLWLLRARTGEAERRGARRAGAVALPALVVPLALAVVGVDFFITRNVIAAWLPAAAVLAAGLAAPRARVAGAAITALLCLVMLGETIGVQADPAYQRADWRGAARTLGPLQVNRAIVVSPVAGGSALGFYLRALYPYPNIAVPTQEVDVIAMAERRQGQTPSPPRPAQPPPPPPGFAFAGEKRSDTYTIIRYRAPAPTPVPPPTLGRLKIAGGLADLLLQLPPGPLRGPLFPPSGAFGGG